MDKLEGTHPCNYEDEGGCDVCGLTKEMYDKLGDIAFIDRNRDGR